MNKRKIVIIILVLCIPLASAAIIFGLPFIGHHVATKQAENRFNDLKNPENTGTNQLFRLNSRIVASTADNKRIIVDLSFDYGKKKALLKELIHREKQLRNIVLIIMSMKHINDIKTSGGKIALREEIKASLNNILKSGKIQKVYISNWRLE